MWTAGGCGFRGGSEGVTWTRGVYRDRKQLREQGKETTEASSGLFEHDSCRVFSDRWLERNARVRELWRREKPSGGMRPRRWTCLARGRPRLYPQSPRWSLEPRAQPVQPKPQHPPLHTHTCMRKLKRVMRRAKLWRTLTRSHFGAGCC